MTKNTLLVALVGMMLGLGVQRATAGAVTVTTPYGKGSSATFGTLTVDVIDAGVECVNGQAQIKGALFANSGIEIPTGQCVYLDGAPHTKGICYDSVNTVFHLTGGVEIDSAFYMATNGVLAPVTGGSPSPLLLRGTSANNSAAIGVQLANQLALTDPAAHLFEWYSDGAATLRGYADYQGTLVSEMGTGTGFGRIATVPTVNVTASGNTADTTEDNLQSYSIPANSFSANGKGVRYTAWGDGVSTADVTTVRCYFGHATTLKSGTLLVTDVLTAAQANTWRVTAEVIRTGAGAQTAEALLVNGGVAKTTVQTNSTPAGTETGVMLIGCTGQRATTSAANSVRQLGGIVEFFN